MGALSGFLHINVQDSFRAANMLSAQAEELESNAKQLAARREELMSVWKGASATRVATAMHDQRQLINRDASNLHLLAFGLRATATKTLLLG